MEQCKKARRQAVADYLETKKCNATVTSGCFGFNKINYTLKKLPLVTCVIPARNHAELTQICLNGLLYHTDYAPFEVILVDNGSIEQDAISLLRNARISP